MSDITKFRDKGNYTDGLEILGGNDHYDLSGYIVLSEFDVEEVDCTGKPPRYGIIGRMILFRISEVVVSRGLLLYTLNVLKPNISKFLKRDINKAFEEVKSKPINRGAGFDLEIPCIHCLYGPKIYLDKMKGILLETNSSSFLNFYN